MFAKDSQPTHDRSLPRKRSLYSMTRKLIVQKATKLGADGSGLDGYAGWVRSCIEKDPLKVLNILITKRNKINAVQQINNFNDEWKLLMIEKMQAQGFSLIEGTIDAEETDES